MITASHNPSKYNGYKAYGSDGCQLGLKESMAALKYIGQTDLFDGVKRIDFDEGLACGTIRYIDDSIPEQYLAYTQALAVHPDACAGSGLKVIYTPLNGSGNLPVREIFRRIGLSDVFVVPEQELPDGNFPTAPYPNPEIRESFTLALQYAQKQQPDLLLATDPDCDRVGIAVRHQGDYVLMTGNQVGSLLTDYVLAGRKASGSLPPNPVVVKTVVTSDMIHTIADKYGAGVVEVLTGFKFIGGQIRLLEEKGEADRYVFGFEESYGYLAGTRVRDKDGVLASMLICEMAAFYKKQGQTLVDVMNALYAEHGLYLHTQISFVCEGISGMQQMKDIMQGLREHPPEEIAGLKVTALADYDRSVRLDFITQKTEKITLPKSNVLGYFLDGGASVLIRPSGTEPKIKLYINAIAPDETAAQQLSDQLKADMTGLMGF